VPEVLIITGWGESGKVILQVSIAVFFGHCRKSFGAKMAQPPTPRKKLARTPMVSVNSLLSSPWMQGYDYGCKFSGNLILRDSSRWKTSGSFGITVDQ